jgi:tripartite-type tricarboxylate transporter receptor subunit TctC
MKKILWITSLALSLCGLQQVQAQTAQPTWPSKPLRFLVAAPAGSSLDVIARAMSDKLTPRLGQSVVVENVAGGSGTIATNMAAKSAPDGHTFVLSFNGPLAFTQFISKLPYDPAKDLTPVIMTTSQPNVLAVNASLPVKTTQELVTFLRANPAKYNYASVGVGSSSHLAMEHPLQRLTARHVLGSRQRHANDLHHPHNHHAASQSRQDACAGGQLPQTLLHPARDSNRA